MELKIKNVLGISSAQINFPEGPTIVTGLNSAGKTSIGRVLAAMLAHDPNPAKLSAAEKKWYIKQGEQVGFAEMNGVKWDPKSGLKVPQGSEPLASPYSVGLVKFLTDSSARKEKMKVWEKLFIPEDPKDLLEPEWTLPKKQLESTLKLIEANDGDWTQALAVYEEQRKESKRQWCQQTGQTAYGVKKAVNWRPPGWDPELEGASPSDLEKEVAVVREKLQEATVRSAVSQDKIDEAKKIKLEVLPGAEETLKAFQIKHGEDSDLSNRIRAEIDEKNAKILKYQAWMQKASVVMDAKAPHRCPECNAGVEFKDGTLIPWVTVDAEKMVEVTEAYQKVKGQLTDLQSSVAMRKGDYSMACELRDNSRSALFTHKGKVEELRRQTKLADETAVEETSVAERAELETSLQEAVGRLDAYNRFLLAQKQHDNVVRLNEICELLGPNGAKAKFMDESMEEVRKMLAKISEVSGWMDIHIDYDFNITSDGLPARLAAKNEQLKAQWALQIASAYVAKSKWVILDEADTLKDDSWDGLIKLVNGLCKKAKDLRVVVCATSSKVKDWNMVEVAK